MQTAVEKILVLWQEDSKAYVKKSREVLEDMIGFWDLPKFYLEVFDSTIAEAFMDKDFRKI